MNKIHSSRVTRCIRAVRLLLHILRGLLTAAIILPRVTSHKRDVIIGNWCRKLLAVFNIRLITYGVVPERDARSIMFVANHVSWIDIYALNSVRTVRFVAKAEIRRWPVFGWLAAQVNTLFTDRERRHDAARMVTSTADSLKQGDCLCYFPEGMTTDGSELKPFKSSLMQAAINANAMVWPVAIRYPGKDDKPNKELSYFDVTLLESVKKVLAQHAPVVELHFASPVEASGHDRRQLSTLARQYISDTLRINQ